MRILRSLTATGLVLAQMVLVAHPASAAVTCSFDPDTAVVRVDMGTDNVTVVSREPGGKAILVDGNRCPGATVRTVDRIRVVGGRGLQYLVIDLSEGPLGPGKTPERTRVSEIEISFEAGLGEDVIIIQGGPSRDFIAMGGAGAALGADGDTDVWWYGVELRSAFGGPAADRLRAAWSGGSNLFGEGGDDVLVGATGRDNLSGGSGDDRISGGSGNDAITGGPGADRVSAGDGADRLWLEDGTPEEAVVCGDGADVVRSADPEDLEIAIGCETVPV